MSRRGKKWSSEEINRFLEEYEKHPSLWDRNSNLYRSKSKREESLKSIVEAMSKVIPDINLDVVKERIRTLRNSYTTERTKVLKSLENSSSSARGGYRPSLEWYDTADRFWREIVEPRTSRGNMDSTLDMTQDSTQEAMDDDTPYCNISVRSPSSLYGADRSYVSDCSPTKQIRISGKTPMKRKIHFENEEEHSEINYNELTQEKIRLIKLEEDLIKKKYQTELEFMKKEHELRMEFFVRKEELQYKILEAELLLKQRQLQ